MSFYIVEVDNDGFKVYDSGGTLIDPATETTVDAIRDNIGEAVASPASNTLLDKLKSILATLDSINLTDGIKKIVDALPVGDNWIGKVKVGDGTNNAAIVSDNSINRLETRNTIVGQTAGAGSEKKVSVIDDVEDSSVKRLQTQALLAPGSTVNIGTSIPADPANLEIEFLTNGASHDMLVDGSTTPVNFTYAPDVGKTVSVESLLLVFAADDFEFDGASFGPLSALTNGIDIKLDIDGVVTTIFTIQQNEDFLRVPGRVPVINNTGPKDLLSAAFSFGGLVKLVQADGDQIIATINDDLTSNKLKYLTATLYGAEE